MARGRTASARKEKKENWQTKRPLQSDDEEDDVDLPPELASDDVLTDCSSNGFCHVDDGRYILRP